MQIFFVLVPEHGIQSIYGPISNGQGSP
ncbi:hypothetical protein KKC1_06790, partial [Calderihabitans maritimus]